MEENNWLKLGDCYDPKSVILNTVTGNTCFIIIQVHVLGKLVLKEIHYP